jgi:hypothetical protein
VLASAPVDALFRWVVAGTFLLTSPFAILGSLEVYRTAAELRAGERTNGTVVTNRLTVDHRDGVEEHAYIPEVSFKSRDGRSHRFTDGTGSMPPDYVPGERVEVTYRVSDPERARILSWKRLWLAPTIFIVVGLLPGSVAWFVLRRISQSS